MSSLCNNHGSFGQPRLIYQQRYRYLIRKLPKAWGDYKRVPKWNIKYDDFLGLYLNLKHYEEELKQEKGLKSRKTFFVKKRKNQIQKNSKRNMNISEITCYYCWVKDHYAKECKDPKQQKPKRKEKKKTSKKYTKIKTYSAAATISTPTWDLRPITVVDDEGVWFARADNNCAQCTRGVRWSLDLACTIHLTTHRESFNM